MGSTTMIDWAHKTVNGLHRVGGGWYCIPRDIGCANCYAWAQDQKFYGLNDPGRTYGGKIPEIKFSPEKYWAIKNIAKPQSIFFNSMTDWAEPRFVKREWALEMLDAAAAASQHLVFFFSKRETEVLNICREWQSSRGASPPRNVLMVLSASTQDQVDQRIGSIDQLKRLGWRVGWSLEPLLDCVNLFLLNHPVDWIQAGGESSQYFRDNNGEMHKMEARPCDWRWLDSIAGQVAFTNKLRFGGERRIRLFIKQVGSNSIGWEGSGGIDEKPPFKKKGNGLYNFSLFPASMQVRELPEGFDFLAESLQEKQVN